MFTGEKETERKKDSHGFFFEKEKKKYFK